MIPKKIRVLVTEDSVFIRKLLVKILESDPEVEVVGVAKNGREAVEMVASLDPDLITMDIRMPVMDGFLATQTIMAENPKPILVISSSISSEDLKVSFNAIRAGALDIIEKPHGNLQSDYREIGAEIIKRVKILSEIRVFRHISPQLQREIPSTTRSKLIVTRGKAVAIGASTGGPSAIHTLLLAIPEMLPVPVFVTQHISEGFGEGYVDWLRRNTTLMVKVAEEGESAVAGTVYFSPDRGLLEFKGRNTLHIKRIDSRDERMSIDAMMSAVAYTYQSGAIGVLLTGMGHDGTQGMKAIKGKGGRTIAQDEKTSVIFGMPQSAIREGVVDHVLPLGDIIPAVMKLLQERA